MTSPAAQMELRPPQNIASDSIRGFNKKFAHNRARARARSVSLVPQTHTCNLNSGPENRPVALRLGHSGLPRNLGLASEAITCRRVATGKLAHRGAIELRSNAMHQPRTPVRGTVQRSCPSCEATACVIATVRSLQLELQFQAWATGNPDRSTHVAPLGLCAVNTLHSMG